VVVRKLSSVRERRGEGSGPVATKSELLDLMQAMEKENLSVKKSPEPHVVAQKEPERSPPSVKPVAAAAAAPASERKAADSDGKSSTRLVPPSSKRTYVDFSTAQKTSKELRVAKRTKKRGEVSV
jgi:hypothetical protein